MNNRFIDLKFEEACKHLINLQNTSGTWTGRLSSSALAGSVAITALKMADPLANKELVEKGAGWLLQTINPDGGFGDTPESISNVSTSLLCYAALSYCLQDEKKAVVLKVLEKYLQSNGIDFAKGNVTGSILAFYQKDLTFSVPILSMLWICGILDTAAARKIPQLPFELSLLPASWYRFINMQVVSYAMPALIAVGIYTFKARGKKFGFLPFIRSKSERFALQKLGKILPESGGFLEAIPLTAFVSMCLVASGNRDSLVVKKGIGFFKKLQREDGSWPIDTDLSNWVTTLAVKAMDTDIFNFLNQNQVESIRAYLIQSQYKEKHPFNQAAPGGWGWTSFAGSVPDADDTSGAVLALLTVFSCSEEEKQAVLAGCQWLVDLQNADGGMPTFCKGWGRLPFDSSCPDLSGHAVAAHCRALSVLDNSLPADFKTKVLKSIQKSLIYLEKNQSPAGSWEPLWFGNQRTANKVNRVYGTAKISMYLQDSLSCMVLPEKYSMQIANMIQKACKYLLEQQNEDGSWGGENGLPGTIEETSLAIGALASFDRSACNRGLVFLEKYISQNGFKAHPIGLYFASLWYDEKLYPVIFYTEALRRLKTALLRK